MVTPWTVSAGLPPVVIEADTAYVTWFGALVFGYRSQSVAHFRKGQWGAWWERGCREADAEPDDAIVVNDDTLQGNTSTRETLEVRPYRGPLTPAEKPRIP